MHGDGSVEDGTEKHRHLINMIVSAQYHGGHFFVHHYFDQMLDLYKNVTKEYRDTIANLSRRILELEKELVFKDMP